MKQTPHIQFKEAALPVAEEAVLSPESHVFVALMSVEEGPNKASFLPVSIQAGPLNERVRPEVKC